LVVVLNVTTLVSELVPKEISFTEPLICRSPELPDTTIVSLPNCPILTSLSAKASITGRPATVLTENKESDRSSEISNNLPLAPSIAKIVPPVELAELIINASPEEEIKILPVNKCVSSTVSPNLVDPEVYIIDADTNWVKN
jgi:hypothetical protein